MKKLPVTSSPPRNPIRRPAVRTVVAASPGLTAAATCGPFLLLLFLGTVPARAQTQTPTMITPISLTLSAPGATTTNAYTQDFNTLASSGTSSSVLPAGFGFAKTATGTASMYAVDNGGGTGGDIYSFGATNSTDRALGTLRDGNATLIIGAVFVNNTGSNLQSLTVSYAGEQWRTGGGSLTRGLASDRLDFQFNPSSSTLTAAGFIDKDNLDFTSPVLALVGGTFLAPGALDGNANNNRTAINYTITGLNIPNGQSFALRWVDFDVAGSDDGLAIDDLRISGIVTVPEPATVAAGMLALGALGWSQRRRLRRMASACGRGVLAPAV